MSCKFCEDATADQEYSPNPDDYFTLECPECGDLYLVRKTK